MKFKVSDMTCAHCEKRITQALKDIGIKKIKINLEAKEVEVKLGKISEQDVMKAVSEAGYTFSEE